MTKDMYIVRTIVERQLVCFSMVTPIFGELALSDMVDEFYTVKECEYARLDDFSIGWPGQAPRWPDYFHGDGDAPDTEEFSSPPQLSELMRDDADDLPWSQFGQGFIYFIRSGDRVKIGYSTNVKERMIKLQTSSPDPLQFIGARPGSFEDEGRLHSLYNDLRTSGEWFSDRGSLARDLRLLAAHREFQTDVSSLRKPVRYHLEY